METTAEIVKNITVLPISQKIEIIKNLLQLLKDDTFNQLENKQISDIKSFHQTFLLNNETKSMHSSINQVYSNESYITKGDKELDPTALFGIWKNKPRNINEIRQQNWGIK